jgi:hypothetical protein
MSCGDSTWQGDRWSSAAAGSGAPQVAVSGYSQVRTAAVSRLVGVPICPDLLDHTAIGEADGWRGRIVRAFFQLMRVWPAR